uniref:nucleotidyltransferase domain-containing protein n=1 Tax=Candidatus Electrothrix sp. TaxID=2170559 RepID=UPI004055A46F
MTDRTAQFENILVGIAESLDIPPSKYKQAVDRYKSIGSCIEDGTYPGVHKIPDIYPQGSFRLGTVVRPIKDGEEADYDIDLVAELALEQNETTPKQVKHLIGDRLKENGTYRPMLDKEGKRCWTIEYAEEDGIGFHVDVLPSIPKNNGIPYAIHITDKEKDTEQYDWKSSNPKGYAEWFDLRNQHAYRIVEKRQREILQENFPEIYAKVEDVPDQLIKTPLQRVIQLLKRHRDIRFSGVENKKDKPISMIITTLSADAYASETDVFSALWNTINNIKKLKKENGKWYIPNPVDPEENFADRWHEDNDKRAKAFFQWIEWVESDLHHALQQEEPEKMQASFSKSFGQRAVNESFRKAGLLKTTIAPTVISRRHVDITEPSKPWRIDD